MTSVGADCLGYYYSGILLTLCALFMEGGAFPDCFVAVAPRNDGRESSRAMTGEEDVGMTGGLAE